jgi:hypothetical protein
MYLFSKGGNVMQLRMIILFFLFLVAGGCSTDDPTRQNTFIPLTSVEVIATYQSMADKTVNQYRAIGYFSGRFTRDITSEVSWSIADNTIATVSNVTGSKGIVTALLPGETSITAFYNDLSDSESVVVTNAFLTEIKITQENAELPVGVVQQYEAAGTFSDGSVQDITLLTNWESSDINVATIDNSGLATTLGAGTCIISGAWEGLESSTNLLISGATLTITPVDATAAQGTSVQFKAEMFSESIIQDITNIVVWQSSAPNIGNINTKGMADAVAPGETEISASFEVDGGTISDITTLTVTDASIESISITPANAIIALGVDQQFTATGTFSDSSQQDITDLATWITTNSSVGTINSSDNQGLFTSIAFGATDIRATFGGISGETGLTVE